MTENDILEEGKYKGQTIRWIIDHDPDWLAKQCDNGKIELDEDAVESLDIKLWDTDEDCKPTASHNILGL